MPNKNRAAGDVTRPRLLDLFCGAGGAGTGYARAGYDVLGVDDKPHPDNPHPVMVTDAMAVLTDVDYCRTFHLIHASPPCQGYSTMSADPTRHPRLIAPVRDALATIGRPYVIENIPGAARHLHAPIKLCGSMFGLAVRRHRYFETSRWVWARECDHTQAVPVGVYGQHADTRDYPRPTTGTRRGHRAASLAEAQTAMGIDWMGWDDDLREAIPPAYTQYLGEQLIDHG